MRRAEILAVGTELLMGQIANTNAQYLSQRLPNVGVAVYYHSVVGDNPARLKESLRLAMSRCDVIIMTGGLGPTQDDLTKETVAECLGLSMQFDAESANAIEAYFSKQGKKMVESNLRQAYFPEGATILRNDNGTAPGCLVEKDNHVIIMLPGPPREMHPMFESFVEPYFSKKSMEKLASAFVKITSLGESQAEQLLMSLIDGQTNPTFATYAKTGDVTLRITAAAAEQEKAEEMVKDAIGQVKQLLGDCVYSVNGESLEEVVVRRYKEAGKTIATAESCTGGMLAQALTAVSGASGVLGYGFVTYSNEAKHKLLGVKEETLAAHGAVSEETALEMCKGLLACSGADVAVSITGIAGPTGGTPQKPIGLVYIGIATKDGAYCIPCHFQGTRDRIRNLTVIKALGELLKCC